MSEMIQRFDYGTIGSAGIIETPLNCVFQPQPDITAFELATLLPYIMSGGLYKSTWERLGTSVTRHLKRT